MKHDRGEVTRDACRPETCPAGQLAAPPARRRRMAGALGWLSGLLLLAVVLAVAARFTEVENFANLLRRARPNWLLVGLVLQASTYVCAAMVLQRSLSRHGVHQSLSHLIPLGLAKLFTDQAVPSVGLSGTLLAVHSLVLQRYLSIVPLAFG